MTTDVESREKSMPYSDQGLRRSQVFDQLDENLRSAVERLARPVRLEQNQILFMQSDPGDALYIVDEGRVEISVMSEGGKKLTLNEMRPGDVFGEIAVLDGGPRTATATTLAPCILRRIDRSEFRESLGKNGALGAALIEVLCARLRWVSQQVEDLAMLDIQGRLASKLLMLHEKFADDEGVLHLSQSELADFVGGRRESTNKILQDWRTNGLIELSRRAIRVRDRERLADFAMPD